MSDFIASVGGGGRFPCLLPDGVGPGGRFSHGLHVGHAVSRNRTDPARQHGRGSFAVRRVARICHSLASAIAHSVAWWDMLLWGAVALVVQLLSYFAVRMIVPTLSRDIPEGKIAQGLFLGTISLAIGS